MSAVVDHLSVVGSVHFVFSQALARYCPRWRRNFHCVWRLFVGLSAIYCSRVRSLGRLLPKCNSSCHCCWDNMLHRVSPPSSETRDTHQFALLPQPVRGPLGCLWLFDGPDFGHSVCGKPDGPAVYPGLLLSRCQGYDGCRVHRWTLARCGL